MQIHMKDAIFLVLAFFLGFGSFFGYKYIKTPKNTMPPASTIQVSITPEPTFALIPPSQAVSGILTITKGKADIFTRTADTYGEATSGGIILTGESIATKEKSLATVEIANLLSVRMDETSEVSFANLYQDDMVLLQKSGTVLYKMTGGNKPISIRVLHNLVALESGEMTISLDGTDVVVSVSSGTAKLAQVDNDNTTHVWDIQEKQRAVIDDKALQVRILKAR
jgi:hypothetical protein